MKRLSTAILLGLVASVSAAPIPIAPLERSTPVDFDREVLPFLRDNCLACHSKTTSKGGLNLETTELMLKGGDTGAAIAPGKSSESLALQAAAHQDDDLKMPPRDNKAKAKDLAPEQLALLKLWIDQGAKPSPKTERVLQWKAVPDGINAIFAVAVSPDGQFAACSRANRIFIYHLPSGRCVATEEAHRDQINALAFSPDGALLASAGYREVKLWRRPSAVPKLNLADAGARIAVSPDGHWFAAGAEDGSVKVWDLQTGQPARTIAAAKGAISALKFSADNAKLACTSLDKSVAIFNANDGNQIARVETPSEVNAVVWLGDKIASAGADGVIRVWTEALGPVKDLAGHAGSVTALDTRASQLLSGGADGSVRTWDIEKGQAVVQMNHGGPVNAVSIRPDGKRFASAGTNNVAKLWDEAGKPLSELRGNRHALEFTAARDRGVQVATSDVAYRKSAQQGAEKQFKDAQERAKKSGEAIGPKQQDLEAKQKAAAESKDAKAGVEQAVAAADAELKKADEALAAAEKAAQETKASAEALKAATPPDQAAIDKSVAEAAAKAQEAEKAKAERAQRETQRKQAAEKIEPAKKKLTETEEALKKSETARSVAENEMNLAKAEEQKTSGAANESKTADDAAEAAKKKADEELEVARKAAADAEKPIRAITFSPDNLTVVTAGDDQLIHTWSAESGAACEVTDGHKAAVTALAFTPAGGLVSAAQDRAALVWDATSVWKLERTIGASEGASPFADRVCAVAFSRDGKLLATGGGEPSRGGEIKLWNPATGDIVRDFPNIHTDTVLGLEFSPDDKSLAAGAADKMARVIDHTTGQLARTFEGHTHHVLSVTWSLDGRTLATAGADNIVKVWDFTTGARRKNIEGYDKEVTAVRFAGASDQLVTSSGDNRVRLVNTEGKEVRAFPEVADYMQSAAITADGKVIVAGGQDSILRIWNAADGKRIAQFPPEAK